VRKVRRGAAPPFCFQFVHLAVTANTADQLRTTCIQQSFAVFLRCNSLSAQGDEVEKLGEYVTGAGGSLGEGWTARRRLRTTGIRAGAYDTYYVSPDGEVRAL